MGMYMYVSEEDRILKRKVDDKEVNESFQAALLCDPSLMIEEHKKYKKKWFKKEYVQVDIWWDIYHEAAAYKAIIYLFTLKNIIMFKELNYRFKNSFQIAKYLTGTGCKREASKLFSTIRKSVSQACYCFRLNYYHSVHANTWVCIDSKLKYFLV